MKLLITRDTQDVNCRFRVYDSTGAELYTITGKDSASIKRIKAFDSTDKCLFKISVSPEIGATVGCNIVTPHEIFGVTIKLKPGELCLKFHGIKLYFRGNLLTRDYEVTDVSQKVLSHHKPEPGKSGCFALEIYDSNFMYAMLAVAVCTNLLSFTDSAIACRA